MDSVTERIAEIIADQAGVPRDSLSPDTPLDTLALDSVAMVEILFALEEAFDLTIPFNANLAESGDFAWQSVAAIAANVRAMREQRQG